MEKLVRQKQIDLAFAHTYKTGVLLAALITLNASIFYGEVSNQVLISWVVYGYIVTLGRTAFYFFVLRRSSMADSTEAKRILLVATMFLSGLVWAIGAVLFLNTDNDEMLIVICLSIAGVINAGLPTLSAYLPALVAFAAPTLVVATIQFYQLGMLSLGLIVLVNSGIVFVVANNANKAIKRSITLDLDNQLLLEQVTREKENAENSRQEAEEANLSKSKFLAAASHDLRQPLAAMGLFIDTLTEVSSQQEDISKVTKNLSQSHQALSRIFDDLLEISQLDSQTVEVKLTNFSLKEFVDELIDEYSPFAAKKQLFMSSRIGDVVICSDRMLLDRITRNLLSNAIKFTQAGGVSISADHFPNEGKIEFAIEDSGIGIDPIFRTQIFDEYFQLNNPERDREKGIGLGLSIVKRLVSMLDSEIKVEEGDGGGTRFVLILREGVKQSVPHESNNLEFQPTPFPALRVLVIDDEKPILEGMKSLLSNIGCEPMLASSKNEAIELLEEGSLRPDLVITDYRLRDHQTGIGAIDGVRSFLGESRLPALLISGDTDPSVVQQIRDQGYLILRKPVKKAQLRKAMHQAISA